MNIAYVNTFVCWPLFECIHCCGVLVGGVEEIESEEDQGKEEPEETAQQLVARSSIFVTMLFCLTSTDVIGSMWVFSSIPDRMLHDMIQVFIWLFMASTSSVQRVWCLFLFICIKALCSTHHPWVI